MEGTPPEEIEKLKKPNYELFGTFEEPESTIEGLTREVLKDMEFISITVDTENKKLIIRTNKDEFNPLEFDISLGENGVSEVGDGVRDDKKHPRENLLFVVHDYQRMIQWKRCLLEVVMNHLARLLYT